MKPVLTFDGVQVFHGDCVEVMRTLADNSVDAVVTDPPYGLEFMGKEWDAPWKSEARAVSATTVAADAVGGFQDGAGGNAFSRSRVRTDTRRHGGDMLTANYGFQQWSQVWATEALRVLKPGGHLLAFGGTRTWHRLAVAIEDAGFEVRDSIAWMYGSGFPKSLDVSKAIDKARNDNPDVLQVTLRLSELAKAAGITRADIDAHMGTSDMGGWWLSANAHRCACPSVENWAKMRLFIPGAKQLDAEVWRLNGRKGTPGEAWAEREVVGSDTKARSTSGKSALPTLTGTTVYETWDITAPATPAAQQWQGWGTALKPAFEPIVVARKPLIGTVSENVQTHGVGGLNIDGCRIAGDVPSRAQPILGVANGVTNFGSGVGRNGDMSSAPAGRWPANVILDESQAAELDKQSGVGGGGIRRDNVARIRNNGLGLGTQDTRQGSANSPDNYGDSGGASRFFYCAKAPKKERPNVDGIAHPTVKPLKLMEYLVRLVTPPGGTVLEPFAGSGATIEAAISQGFQVIAIEQEWDYIRLIEARLSKPIQEAM